MGKVEALTTEPAVVAYKQRHQTTTKLKPLTGEDHLSAHYKVIFCCKNFVCGVLPTYYLA